MRIGFDLHGLHDLFQGSRTYACNTAKALLAADASNAYNLYLPEPNDPEVRREFGRGNTRLLPIPASRRARLVWPFPQTLGRDGVDVLHCHYMGPLFCPVPYVVSIHDIIHETNPEFFPGGMRRLMRLLYPRSARRAAMVLTISEYSKRQIMTHYNIPEERIAFRHCGVSEEFRVLEDRRAVDAVKAKYGIRTPYVLFVGRIEPRKNLPRLIEAFLRISGGFPHTLVAAGMMDEIFKPFYEAVVKEKGRDRVLFTGRVEQEDLPALYNGADLFAYPSHAEGFVLFRSGGHGLRDAGPDVEHHVPARGGGRRGPACFAHGRRGNRQGHGRRPFRRGPAGDPVSARAGAGRAVPLGRHGRALP